MAEWNERGYVPDSDDEEDELLELVSWDSPYAGTKFNTDHKQKDFESDTHAKVELPRPEIQAEAFLHQPQNGQDGGIQKEEKEMGNDPMLHQDPATMSPTQLKMTGNSVAEQLRNELRSGLQIVKQVLSDSSATIDDQSDHQSRLSSPLSSARSFSAEPSLVDDVTGAVSREPFSLNELFSKRSSAKSTDNRRKSVSDFESGGQPTGRHLRQRNAIQLHPYALEGARYQKELLAHGVKPIHVAGSLRQRSSDPDGQDHEFPVDNAGEQFGDAMWSEPDFSSPFRPVSHNVIRKHPETSLLDDGASDQELPELDAILGGEHGGLRQIKKRLRVKNGPQATRIFDQENEFHIYDLPSDSAGFTLGGSPDHRTFHVPASPPGTRSAHSSQSDEALPRTLTRKTTEHRTLQTLPTPDLSSATYQPTGLALHIENESESAETGTAQESSRPGSQQSPEYGAGQLVQLQRKTKGVLPASFFRLQDQQREAKGIHDRHRSLSPDRDGDAPEIAHRLHQPRNRQTSLSRASSNAMVVSDDSLSEDSSMSSVRDFEASVSPNRYNDMMGLVEGDIEEDNAIDQMMQPYSRKRSVAGPTKKRQRRISEFNLGVKDRTWNERTQRRTLKRRKGLTLRSGSQRREGESFKVKTPLLGPLDAPGYTETPRALRPRFLRVATRLAISRRTCGRQSPSRKFLRLATSLDTHEANIELTNWREGRAKQNSKLPIEAPLKKGKQLNHSRPSQSLGQGSQDVPFSGCRTFVGSLPQIAQNQWQVQHHAAPHRLTEDVIQETMLHQRRQSTPSTNVLPEPIQRPVDDVAITRPGPSVSANTLRQNRSGRGTLLSSTTNLAKPREAQFEAPAQLRPRDRVLGAFRGSLTASQSGKVQKAIPEAHSYKRSVRRSQGATPDAPINDARKEACPRPLQKRAPRQVDTISRKIISQPELSDNSISIENENPTALAGVALAGLGSPELPITCDFGINPFRINTRLDQTTFIGGGQLFQVIQNLVHQPRFLVQSTSDTVEVIRPSMAEPPYRWGLWNTSVSQQLSAWFVELKGCLGIQNPQKSGLLQNPPQNVLAATTSLTLYLSCQASFKDHHDLITFVEEAFLILQDVVWQIESECEPCSLAAFPDLLRLLCLLLIFVFEVACVTASTSADQGLQTKVCKIFRQLALVLLKVVFRDDHLANIVNRPIPKPDVYIIGCGCPEAEAIVIVNNLSKQPMLGLDVWELIAEALLYCVTSSPERVVTFHDYDRWWKATFSALPFLEIDASGLLQRNSGSPGWNLVQRLLDRFLSLFMPRRYYAGYSTKHYGRVLIQRCLDLVQVWGWQGGHSAIGTLFDAYHSNSLNELFGETCNHPFCIPLNLAPSMRITVEKTGPGFHVFLGFLAQTILDSRKPDADPKLAKRVLRSLSARLVPSKGGDFSRNTTPRLHDINALRNRFDLVYIMYSTMPLEMKPNLRLFQSFVDFRSARGEVCRLALECWSRLVQQEICNEGSVNATVLGVSDYSTYNTLVLLKEWHESMVIDLLTEYVSGGAEALVSFEGHHTGVAESRDISDKRKLVAEVLKEALKAVEQSFGFCHSAYQATMLLSQRMLGEVFKLFNAENPASSTLISAALQVITTYTRTCVPPARHTAPINEDSQEYGSWDHFDAMDVAEEGVSDPNKDDSAHLLHEVQPMLRRFLSNVFGSDAAPNPAILKSTADCWYEVSGALVRVKTRSWDDFVGQYSTDSWESLRHTRQCQQYKVYFLAKIVDDDYSFYEANRLHILNLWISALCRPTHLLCWEHFLSSVILFHNADDTLLFNAPFVVRSESGKRMEIPMVELRERRLAMIYVIFRNMYILLTTPPIAPQTSTPYSKADFSLILKSIESTMRGGYQDLEAHSPAQREYLDFINLVIQQMQLYVVEFHKIDPFFMDPAVSSAEEYVVTASLKRYGLTIQSTGVTKAMVLFFYSASEGAAINDSQRQLVLQLQNAFLDLRQAAVERTEDHEPDALVLTLFLQHVLPAYLGHAFSAPGHIVAGPVLKVLSHVYQNLRCRSDVWNPASLQALAIASQVLFQKTVDVLRICEPNEILASYDRLDNFNELVLSIHAAMLRMYEAAEAFPDQIDPSNLIELLLVLKDHVLAIEEPLDVHSDLLDVEADQDIIADTAIGNSAMGTYAGKELQNALDQTWRQNASGSWEIIGRGPAKVIKASAKTMSGVVAKRRMEQCKERTSFVVREFLEAFTRLDW